MSSPVVWITGAGGGIGGACALALGAMGWTVWATDADVESAADVAAMVEHAGGAARSIGLDVTDLEEVDAVARRIADRDGGLDAAVVNAAVFPREALGRDAAARLRAVLDVNVVGAAATVVGARFAMRSGGSIVVLTSGSGARKIARIDQQRGFAAYGASKAALERWVLGVCDELAGDGIAVHLLCPGGVVTTPGVGRVLTDAEMSGAISPELVAGAVAHLCSVRDIGSTGARYLATDYGVDWGMSAV